MQHERTSRAMLSLRRCRGIGSQRPAPWLCGLIVWLGVAAGLAQPSAGQGSAQASQQGANQEQRDQAVLEAVHGFLLARTHAEGREVVIEVHPLTARLPPCEAPEPFLPRASETLSGRVTVGVRCGNQGRQVRYFKADIDLYGDYPVLKEPAEAGTLITAGMLESQQGNLSELPHDAVRAPESIIGQIARRSLAAGVPLQQRQFRARPLVERGQRVVVEARGARFRATREGVAMDSGVAGERVRVRFSNRELVEAVVVGEARLEIQF